MPAAARSRSAMSAATTPTSPSTPVAARPSADASGGDNNVAIAGGGQVGDEAAASGGAEHAEPGAGGQRGSRQARRPTGSTPIPAGARRSGPALVQVADEPDDTGAIIAEAKMCTIPQPQQGYDWFGQCTTPATDMSFSLYPERRRRHAAGDVRDERAGSRPLRQSAARAPTSSTGSARTGRRSGATPRATASTPTATSSSSRTSSRTSGASSADRAAGVTAAGPARTHPSHGIRSAVNRRPGDRPGGSDGGHLGVTPRRSRLMQRSGATRSSEHRSTFRADGSDTGLMPQRGTPLDEPSGVLNHPAGSVPRRGDDRCPRGTECAGQPSSPSSSPWPLS